MNQGGSVVTDRYAPDRWWEAHGALSDKVDRMAEAQAGCSAATGAAIEELRRWKKDQNGDIRETRDDIKKIRGWLISLLGGLVVALLLLIVNIALTLSNIPTG